MVFENGMSVDKFRKILEDKKFTHLDFKSSRGELLYHQSFKEDLYKDYFRILGTPYICAYEAITGGHIVLTDTSITITYKRILWVFY